MRFLTNFLKSLINLVATFSSGILVTYAFMIKNPNYNWIEFALFMFVGIVVGLSVDSICMVIFSRKYDETLDSNSDLAKAIIDEYEKRERDKVTSNTENNTNE